MMMKRPMMNPLQMALNRQRQQQKMKYARGFVLGAVQRGIDDGTLRPPKNKGKKKKT